MESDYERSERSIWGGGDLLNICESQKIDECKRHGNRCPPEGKGVQVQEQRETIWGEYNELVVKHILWGKGLKRVSTELKQYDRGSDGGQCMQRDESGRESARWEGRGEAFRFLVIPIRVISYAAILNLNKNTRGKQAWRTLSISACLQCIAFQAPKYL